jgi:hypothetical protein
VRVSALIACVIVAAVADSRGALTTSTYLGLLVGVASLWWLGRRGTQRAVLPHPLTRLYIARERFAHGRMSVEEFEREAADLLERGEADEPVRLVIVDSQLLHQD